MVDTHEDRRKLQRRKGTRRVYDMLEGKATEEERISCDRMFCDAHLDKSRRVLDRRSGEDRREG